MTKEIMFAGKSKPLDEIDFHDFVISPIWIFALDEEETEVQDETWVRPIASPINVSSDLYEAYILLHTQNGHIPVFAHIDTKDLTLCDIWIKGGDGIPVELKDAKEELPLILVSYVPIEGKENIRFVVASTKENAALCQEDKVLFQKKKWWQRFLGK